MILCTSDLHLTDRAEDDYRWAVFDAIAASLDRYPSITAIYILGDAWDRRDRHSAVLVNRTVTEFTRIAERVPLTVLRGNHDTPLRDPAFWQFLNEFRDLDYVTEPTVRQRLLLAPFTATPKQTWHGIRFRDHAALFMHATVSGAVFENGTVMEHADFPLLPRSLKVYSGDVHVPQQIGGITYVGAPHPIRFGDRYKCRMLVLDDHFDIAHEIILHPQQKIMADITSLADLIYLGAAPGDQVKIRFAASPADVENWGQIEAALASWAVDNRVTITGTEVALTAPRPGGALEVLGTPEQILRDFAAHERLTEELLTTGLSLLTEVQG
jgi:hypothetical protein